MNTNYYPTATVFMLPLLFTTTVFAANPYRFEVSGTYGKANTKIEESFFIRDGEVESDVNGGSITYFLRPVDTPNGPLAERAFMDKAAYITGNYSSAKSDQDREADTMGLNARFVTSTNWIFELGYDLTDTGAVSDDTVIALGLGKYLDEQSTAVLSYRHLDDGTDENSFIVSGTYKNVRSNKSTGTAFSSALNLNYIDTGTAGGFGFGFGGSHYFSEAVSIGIVIDFEKVRRSNLTTLGLAVNYFITENIFTSALYTQSETNSSDVSTVNLAIGARF